MAYVIEETVIFHEQDRTLIEQIKNYQAQKGISFSEAIKELCEKALTTDTVLKWGTFGCEEQSQSC